MAHNPLSRLATWWPAALIGLVTLLNSFAEGVRTLLT